MDTNADTLAATGSIDNMMAELRMRLSHQESDSCTSPARSFKDINPILHEFRDNFIALQKELEKKNLPTSDESQQPRRVKTLDSNKSTGGIFMPDSEARLMRIMTKVQMMQDKSLLGVPVAIATAPKKEISTRAGMKDRNILNLDRFDYRKELEQFSNRQKDAALENELSSLLESLIISKGTVNPIIKEADPVKGLPPDLAALLTKLVRSENEINRKISTQGNHTLEILNEDEELEDTGFSKVIHASSLKSKKTIMNVWKSSIEEAAKKPSQLLQILEQLNEESFRIQPIKDLSLPSPALVPVVGERGHQEKSSFMTTIPLAPKQYIDPRILVVETQLRSWERLVSQMRKTKRMKRQNKKRGIASLFDAGQIIVKLQTLGLNNPNLLSRVDKSTLIIVLQIKLWQRRALDIRLHRSANTRKLLTAFNRELAISVPVSIARSIAVHAIEILQLCQQKYEWNLGRNHTSTLDCLDRIDALSLNLPKSFSLFNRKKQTIMKRLAVGTRRVHPSNFGGYSNSDLELGRARFVQFSSLDSSDSLSNENSRKLAKLKSLKVSPIIEESEER